MDRIVQFKFAKETKNIAQNSWERDEVPQYLNKGFYIQERTGQKHNWR